MNRRDFLKTALWVSSSAGLLSCGKESPQPARTPPATSADRSGQVKSKLIDIISRQLQVEKQTVLPAASIVKDLGADSLDVVELVMEIEEEFDMSIPDEDAERLHTVGELIAYVEKNAQGKAPPARK